MTMERRCLQLRKKQFSQLGLILRDLTAAVEAPIASAVPQDAGSHAVPDQRGVPVSGTERASSGRGSGTKGVEGRDSGRETKVSQRKSKSGARGAKSKKAAGGDDGPEPMDAD
jgi:hypothetical protein